MLSWSIRQSMLRYKHVNRMHLAPFSSTPSSSPDSQSNSSSSTFVSNAFARRADRASEQASPDQAADHDNLLRISEGVRAQRDMLLRRLPSDSSTLKPYSENMGGRAVDPSLRAPWQRNLQIATVVVAALLSWSMVTIAPKYQRDATLNEEDSNRIAAAINTGDSKAVLEAVNQSVAAKTQ